MPEWSAIALFCEDIREEKTGQDTLIGILPDNVRVPSFPGAMPKVCVYLRINLPRDTAIRRAKSRLDLPDGTSFAMANLDEVLDQAKQGATTHDTPYLGLISKAQF